MKLNWFLSVIVSVVLLSNVVLAYNPPIFIANPETNECKYYFAGDEKHFNPRPEGFTVDIGATTAFEDVDAACELWKTCVEKGNTWEEGRCITKVQNKITGTTVVAEEVSEGGGLDWTRIIITSLVVILVLGVVRKVKKKPTPEPLQE